eukprot:4147890-Amphidinium_carterae.1
MQLGSIDCHKAKGKIAWCVQLPTTGEVQVFSATAYNSFLCRLVVVYPPAAPEAMPARPPKAAAKNPTAAALQRPQIGVTPGRIKCLQRAGVVFRYISLVLRSNPAVTRKTYKWKAINNKTQSLGWILALSAVCEYFCQREPTSSSVAVIRHGLFVQQIIFLPPLFN